MKSAIVTLLVIFTLLISYTPVLAKNVAGSSAYLSKYNSETKVFDYRVVILKNYFSHHNSPLENHAESFVEYADFHNLDWRLVPAITGVESTFGKRIPKNSYNAYGWANGDYSFESWEHSIGVVSKSLDEKYYEKGAKTIDQISRKYAPPSNTWAWKVKYFMKEIDKFPINFSLES